MGIIIYCCVSVLLAAANVVLILRMTENKRRKIVYASFSAVSVALCCVFCVIKGTAVIYGCFLLAMTAVFSLITAFDLKNQYIPNILLLILNVLGLVCSFFVPDYFFIKSLIGAWGVTGLCFLVGRRAKQGVGAGDLFSMSGLMMSLDFAGMMNFIFMSLFLGSVYGIISLIFRKKTMKTEMPFAPFMLVGYLCAVLFV